MTNTTTQQVPVAAGTTVINEETYNTLRNMLKSVDEGDHKMAQLILNQVDIPKSIYWIWKLSRDGYGNRMVNLRTKASRMFRDKSRLFYIWSKGPSEFASFLAREGWITPELFAILKKDVLQNLKFKSSNTFYDISINLKPQYVTLDPDDYHRPIIEPEDDTE